MFGKVITEEPVVPKYFLDRYNIQEISDKAGDACVPALKFVPDWFNTNEMLEKLGNVVLSNGDIDLDDIDCDTVTFFSDGIGLVTIEFNNINLDDYNFDEGDTETIIHVRLMTWCNRSTQRKTCKDDKD